MYSIYVKVLERRRGTNYSNSFLELDQNLVIMCMVYCVIKVDNPYLFTFYYYDTCIRVVHGSECLPRAPKNIYRKIVCLKEIGLHAQNMIINCFLDGEVSDH